MKLASLPVTATCERTIDAGAEAILQARTEPEELKAWFGPGGFRTIEAEVDLRVGGRYRLLTGAPDGGLLTIIGEYRQIERRCGSFTRGYGRTRLRTRWS